jgi:hypothetical protein
MQMSLPCDRMSGAPLSMCSVMVAFGMSRAISAVFARGKDGLKSLSIIENPLDRLFGVARRLDPFLADSQNSCPHSCFSFSRLDCGKFAPTKIGGNQWRNILNSSK